MFSQALRIHGKRIAAQSVCILLLAAGNILRVEAMQEGAKPEAASARPGSLDWYAHNARMQGKTEITLPKYSLLYAELEPLQEAFLRTTVVVATLLQSETARNGDQIFTWRKYRVDERLSRQEHAIPPDVDVRWQHTLIDDVPGSLLPLGPDEFIVADYGGTVTVGGVRITDPGPGLQALQTQTRHLMFLIFGANGEIAVSNYGPPGMLSVDSSGSIRSRVPQAGSSPTGLLREIDERTDGKLSSLRSISSAWAKAAH